MRVRVACIAAAAAFGLAIATSATLGQTAPAPSSEIGTEVQLVERPIVYFKGTGNWDSAYDTLIEAFKNVNDYLKKQGIKPVGPPMTIYVPFDDDTFAFQAAIPVAELPKDMPRGDIEAGMSPAGRAYKFVHRGAYDGMEKTFEAIRNFIDDKQLDPADSFIEQYVTDPLTTPEDKLVIEIYVPVN